MFVTGFPSTEITPELKEVIEHYKVGNIILFSHNIDNKYQLGELVTELQQWYTTHTGIPGFITIDQEGGRVTVCLKTRPMLLEPWQLLLQDDLKMRMQQAE